MKDKGKEIIFKGKPIGDVIDYDKDAKSKEKKDNYK